MRHGWPKPQPPRDGLQLLLAFIVIFIVSMMLSFGFFIYSASRSPAKAQEFHSNPWLKSWISAACCVSHDCCWQIGERELIPLPDDQWEVRSTGQVRKRDGWSPDGKFYRCACDYDTATARYIRHQGAKTTCLFVPMRMGAHTKPSR